MRVEKKIFNHIFNFNNGAKWNWTHFKIHQQKYSGYSKSHGLHIVFGKLSFSVGQPHLEEIEICADCDSDEILHSRDGVSFCESCRSVENTKYMTVEEWESQHG